MALALAGCAVELEPISQEEHQKIAQDRLDRVIADDQEPVAGKIDLYEAMARAIKYNLDHQVEITEQALRIEELNLSTYDQLPDLVANAEYTGRSNDPGASSISLLTGTESLEPSRSTERNVLDADLTLSWDILDFGLSYVRSKQRADDVLIALEQRRSAINRVIEDVRTAYWRAVSAERLSGRLARLESEVQRELSTAEQQASAGVAEPFDALVYQRELLQNLRAVQELRRDLGVAKNQLAALINLRQQDSFQLDVSTRHSPPVVTDPTGALINHAMVNRPELREITYRLRRNNRELDAAFFEALPSLRGFVGGNISTNEFLFNQGFVGWGAQASWNLLNVFRYPQREATVEAGANLLDSRALALVQAISTQVVVSKKRVESLQREHVTASKARRINAEILRQVSARETAGATGRRDRIREELNAILAELRHDLVFADLQNAYANLYASIGADAYAPGLTGDESVSEMATALRALWAGRGDRGARG